MSAKEVSFPRDLPRKSEFSEWYSEVLWRAEIVDTRYPVKGVCVWYPFGFKLRNLIYGILRSLLDESGHQEALFPLLIPRSELLKEEKHIKGFEGEVFWVTRGGFEELEMPLALRPTSETAIYPMFNLWIRSHRDLPIRIYQVVNVFRYETKHTRPLIRVREITSFKEAHTAHATREDAERQVRTAVEIYKQFFERLAVPFVVTKRPDWDKFPGAEYTIAFDTLMPDGRTMQIATIHMLGENFSRTFDITFEDADGTRKFVQQTCYGISERCVAAVIAIHGDDHGLVLPPEVAPVQVVVVPILFSKASPAQTAQTTQTHSQSSQGSSSEQGISAKEQEASDAENTNKRVLEVSRSVCEALKSAGIRVVLDDSEERPGAKFYKWEMKGVPLRIEIGPRDLQAERCVLVKRNDFQRKAVNIERVVPVVRETLSQIHAEMREKAWRKFAERMHIVRASGAEEDGETVLQEMSARVSEGGGIFSVFICDSEDCGRRVKETAGVSVLGEPCEEQNEIAKCIICSKDCSRKYVAKAY